MLLADNVRLYCVCLPAQRREPGSLALSSLMELSRREGNDRYAHAPSFPRRRVFVRLIRSRACDPGLRRCKFDEKWELHGSLNGFNLTIFFFFFYIDRIFERDPFIVLRRNTVAAEIVCNNTKLCLSMKKH